MSPSEKYHPVAYANMAREHWKQFECCHITQITKYNVVFSVIICDLVKKITKVEECTLLAFCYVKLTAVAN